VNSEEKIRILFVDDEPNILSGIRRMLRHRRKDWDMIFSRSGAEALENFHEKPADIVVSDIMMPGMDGVELLETIRKTAPETVRLALSGYADKNTTLRAVAQIHQFITKPCDAESLAALLDRAVKLRRFLADERLRRIVTQMETLPSIAVLYDDVVRELHAPDSAVRDIGAIIARDPGMSTKVLQLANSALFGLPEIVSDPVQATVLLGLDTIKLLVLSIKLFEEFSDMAPEAGISEAGIWRHSLISARLAKRILIAENPDEHLAECAFLSGLLHDVGKLVFAANFPERYLSARRLGKRQPEQRWTIERNIMGATHGEVGGYLIGLWGFSEEIISGIVYHHHPEMDPMAGFTPLSAIHVANALVMQCEETVEAENASLQELNYDWLESQDLLPRLPVWRKMCQQTLREEKLIT
jgi:HD-like signal output (HDOD) protein